MGSLLFAGGALILAYVCFVALEGAVARQHARTEWAAREAHDARLAMNAALEVRTPAPSALGAPVAHLLIPKIGLDEVVVEGVDGDELNAGPGHMPGSVLPGEAGNSVISAHRDRHFHALDGVDVGDTLVTESAAGRQKWIVIARRVVARGAPALFAATEPTLTLTTCWPLDYIGSAPDRLIVTARPVSAPRQGQRA